MHAYPSEHGGSAHDLRAAIARYPVAVVDMGHTHYNELANDGHTIYAATRSTGQIEEGKVGFSVTTIDRGVVSWKFNELGHWPFVKIIAPADQKLIIDPASHDQVVRGTVNIRARVWGAADSAVLSVSIDGGEPLPMTRIADTNCFAVAWPTLEVADGSHQICVRAVTARGSAQDTVTALCSQSGPYAKPQPLEVDLDNTVGAYPEKGVLGTRLGPNANGRKW
jgi:Icc protein